MAEGDLSVLIKVIAAQTTATEKAAESLGKILALLITLESKVDFLQKAQEKLTSREKALLVLIGFLIVAITALVGIKLTGPIL